MSDEHQAVSVNVAPPGGPQRQHQRYSFQAPVLVTPHAAAAAQFGATTRNISRGGMFVATTLELPIDALITAEIIPVNAGSILVEARVVHVHPGDGFGCCFVAMSPKSAARLDTWLGRCGGLPPVSGVIG